MNAREMFKESGFNITNTYPLADICYELINNYDNKFFVLFNKKFKHYTTLAKFKHERNHTYYPGVDIKIHQAIHQQMKELGWIE